MIYTYNTSAYQSPQIKFSGCQTFFLKAHFRLVVVFFTLLLAGWATANAQTPFEAFSPEIGATECPESNVAFNEGVYTDLPTGVSFSGFTRVNVGCNDAGSHYRSSGFTSTSLDDAIEDETYVSWSFNASPTITFSLSEISIRHERSNQGADRSAVFYSIDGGAFEQVGGVVNIGTSNGRDVLVFNEAVTIPAGGNIEFRWYAWTSGGPTGNGNIRFKGGTDYDGGSGIVGVFTEVTPAFPVISASVTELDGFLYALSDGPSAQQSFNVSGASLNDDISIEPSSTNFEISLTGGEAFVSEGIINLTRDGDNSVSETSIFVRLRAGLPADSYTAEIEVSSPGATATNIDVSGQVISELLPYEETFGTIAGIFPLGWSTSGPGANNWTVGTSTSSTGSGGANLQDDGNIVGQEAIVTVNRGISTVGADQVLVSFLARRTGAYSGEVQLDYSTDGNTWVNVPFTDVANNATWAPVNITLPEAASGVENLRLRLRTTRANTSGNYRIDDFTVFAPTVFGFNPTGGSANQLTAWLDANGNTPTSFTADNQVFVFNNPDLPSVTIAQSWTVSGENSQVIVGNGADFFELRVGMGIEFDARVSVTDFGRLLLLGDSIPELISLDTDSFVTYGMQMDATIQPVAYGNLILQGDGSEGHTFTFLDQTYLVNGNLNWFNTRLNFAGEDSRIDFATDFLVSGSLTYEGSQRPNIRTTGQNLQLINVLDGITLEVFNFYAENKTEGGLLLPAGNANIRALNNLRLDFSGNASFTDNGNTIIFGDDLEIRGDASSYNLTGTIRLEAESGSNDFDVVEVPLNNLEIFSEGSSTVRFGRNTAPLVQLNGDLVLSSNGDEIQFAGVELRVGGDITLLESSSSIDTGSSLVVLNGDSDQQVSAAQPFEFHNLRIEKSAGEVTLTDEIRVSAALELEEGVLVSDGNLVLTSGARITNGGSGSISGLYATERLLDPASAPDPGSGQFVALGSPLTSSFVGANGLFGSIWTQGAVGASVEGGSANIFRYDPLIPRANENDNSGWLAVEDLTENVNRGEGYLAFVYTNDVFGVEGSWPKTLRSAGLFTADEINENPVALPVQFESNIVDGDELGGFNLVSNPFASPLLWGDGETGIIRTSVENIYWVLHDTGTFDVWNGELQVGTGIADGRIAANQAFFVQATVADAELSLTSAAKTDDAVFFRDGDMETPLMRIALESAGGKSEVLIIWNSEFAAKNGIQMITPAGQAYTQLFVKEENSSARIVRYLNPETADVITLPLAVAAPQKNDFQLNFSEIELPSGWEANIIDQFTGQKHPVELTTELTFDASQTSVSDPLMRFTLELIPPGATSTGEGTEIPAMVDLQQNYPNPFNPATLIRYALPESAQVRLEVYNIAGQRVATLVNAHQTAGWHDTRFDGSALSSGVYLYRLTAGNTTITRKMLLVK
ncbi:MAG: T9SS type A sorting domain-containing protein [Balneolales bacterium]|nr:T9SS type A sorting domain-containing protein [Balneolales bacterium]